MSELDPIGYYVHHHGVGHAARYRKIADASSDRIIPISELQFADGVRLPRDVVPAGYDPGAGGALHWAPVGDRGSARRSLIFGTWLAGARPCGVVVDVSVEAALLCRLFGVATVVVRQHGDRTDGAHEMAYRSAVRLLAPFPSTLEHVSTPEWVRNKTTYAGLIGSGPFAPETADHEVTADLPHEDDIVILWGAGGGEMSTDDLAAIVVAAGDAQVWFAGQEPFSFGSRGVRSLGWVDDVPALLRHGPTVVGSAGNNVVADAASAGCALVVVPQMRPFGEQVRCADSLDAAAAAAIVTPGHITNWPQAIGVARERRAALGELARCAGAGVAADAIHDAFECKVEVPS